MTHSAPAAIIPLNIHLDRLNPQIIEIFEVIGIFGSILGEIESWK